MKYKLSSISIPCKYFIVFVFCERVYVLLGRDSRGGGGGDTWYSMLGLTGVSQKIEL